MDANHTPTPWTTGTHEYTEGMARGHKSAWVRGPAGHIEVSAEDAAFIVRAANSHDQLVAALKEIVENAKAADQGDIEAWAQELYECGKTARAALDLAKA